MVMSAHRRAVLQALALPVGAYCASYVAYSASCEASIQQLISSALKQIDASRRSASSLEDPFVIFSWAAAFAQAAASARGLQLDMEVASLRSAPAAWSSGATSKAHILRLLGFSLPKADDNWQRSIVIESAEHLHHAARSMAMAMWSVFCVRDVTDVSMTVYLPNNR
jgi:hypothetical protein